MTNQSTTAREVLEHQLDDLDIPILMITDALEVLGDLFDIDTIEFIDALDSTEALREFALTRGEKEVEAMRQMMDLALESSTQIAQTRTAIEISRVIATIED